MIRKYRVIFMNKIKKLSKEELKLLAKEDELSPESKKKYLGILLIFLLMIVLSVFQINYTLSSGYRLYILPYEIIILIFFVCFFTFLLYAFKMKMQLVFIKLNDSISKPSSPSYFFKQNKVFIKFNQIRYFQYIKNKDGDCTGIQITTNDNRIIKYKYKYLGGRIFEIDKILKYHNIKLNKKPA